MEMDRIVGLIERGLWDDALDKYVNYIDSAHMDEKAYIVGATIMEHYEKYGTMFDFIMEGLKIAPCNYELYLLLGNYYRYSKNNIDQAYLSYENAMWHCLKEARNENDISEIEKLIKDLEKNEMISTRNVSIVILSYNTLEYTKICIESIRDTCYDGCCEIIVVDNASDDGSIEWLREQKDIVLIENSENTGFPAGCNNGIKAADQENDILLLNNDTIMLPNSLYWLRIGLYENEDIGSAGAVTNYASNDQIAGGQYETIEEYISYGTGVNIPMVNPYELKLYLVMFATLIKREALNKVGLLDELFSPGNFEDNDYGIRLLENGYKSILCHNSYIFHFGSKSFGKNRESYYERLKINRNKFKDKWGFYDDYYTHVRSDIIAMMNPPENKHIKVLEIGCGLGETLAKIGYLFPGAEVHGIELVDTIASIGNNRFDIRCGDIENMELDDDELYDYVIFADVLEHLRYPEDVLVRMRKHLTECGYVLTSIPNVMNAGVIKELLAGNFTYRDAGILDRTHLRFFTLNEIRRMFQRAGYDIDQLSTTVLPEESTKAHKDFFDRLIDIDGVASRELFDIYQFVIKASPCI